MAEIREREEGDCLQRKSVAYGVWQMHGNEGLGVMMAINRSPRNWGAVERKATDSKVSCEPSFLPGLSLKVSTYSSFSST